MALREERDSLDATLAALAGKLREAVEREAVAAAEAQRHALEVHGVCKG